ncbi:MAG: exodeoxyribonuclease VII large subunit, partial [Sediminibacterium sp.]|nr:exodeoxyribonuclease VII large subunit [Sediminibacterium sp.]
MPEDKQIFSLSMVANSISKTLKERYKQLYWIKAEMNKLNYYSYSGHCYPELVEKKDQKVIAQVKAIIWKTDFIRINKIFSEVVKEELKDGIKILFQASITYDAVHGLSLIIQDIDPQFSLGDLEFEKKQTIEKLNQLHLFHTNKEKKLPLLPKRIAIISVQTSKGYVDFMNLLQEIKKKYVIDTYLFPAILQGSEAITTIIQQLKNIAKLKNHFDAVAIIRGGGGDIGLSCYNHFELCKEICSFPLPILCGIGHATNETVCEMVAYFSGITPSKLASFLIQKYDDFNNKMIQMQHSIIHQSQYILN